MKQPGLLALLLLGAGLAQAAPAITAGEKHTVALGADGIVRAWGDDRSGQLGAGRRLSSPVPIASGLGAVTSVSAGDGYTLAVRADGTLWGWGYSGYAQLAEGREAPWSVPAPIKGLGDVVDAAARHYAVAALKRDGTVWTWGGNDDGNLGDGTLLNRSTPAPVVALTGVMAIAQGDSHMAALRGDGLVFTWGRNNRGQLGDGTRDNRSTPSVVAGLTGVKRISASGGYTLALREDGSVWIWGSNEGELGDLSRGDRLVPVRIGTLPVIKEIAAGPTALALAEDGSVWDWGYGAIGGRADTGPGRIVGLNDVIGISPGGAHTAVLKRDGTVWGWGYNDLGQLADGTREFRSAPVQAQGISDVVQVSAGYAHTAVRRRDGTIWSWGENSNGALADGSLLELTTPVVAVGLTQVTQVSAGDFHTVALRGDGTVWAWGANEQGRLGIGNNAGDRSSPVQVPNLSGASAVAAGGVHTLALKSDGTVWAWGFSYSGQLGTGMTHDGNGFPVQSVGLTGMTRVSAGYLHSVALKADGTVWTWGDNASGQLGDGSSAPERPTPAQLAGISGVSEISAGHSHTLALRSDGSVWAWGDNAMGQLGDGTRESRRVPRQVTGLPRIQEISAGGGGSLALAVDGTVWIWGENIGGSGTDANPLVPARVAGLTDVVGIAAGRAYYYGHSAARRRDGTVFTWGTPWNGQLGDGTYVERSKAVVVVREGGGGSIAANNWFLDLNPALPKSIPPDRIPVFSVVASGNDNSYNADIRFRAQDVGKGGSVFVFAYAPAGIVKHAEQGASFGLKAKARGKDTATACVLAQLNAAGQLVAVTAESMRAFVTGVLGAQGQSVNILNGVSPASIAGATFYVGYGASGTAMLSGGTNRSVLSAQGGSLCQPQAPKTGWWWNPKEDGRGFSLEVSGNNLFFAAFLYDVSGRSTWLVSTGPISLDGSLYTGDLLSARGGQSLGGAYSGRPTLANAGPISLVFNTATEGVMSWPGGTVPIQRFDIVQGGAAQGPATNAPESGWWWNDQEDGRGFFMEWQGNTLDIAGYMYDDAGNAVWYLTVGTMAADGRTFSGNWWSYGNGQTLTGAWKPNVQLSNSVAPVTITFPGPDTALMTLPNQRTTSLKRYRF